jgi:hypothetical protein
MCRKCLKTASDESRRCSTCGGRVVRFSDSGEVIEIDVAGEEPTKLGGGVPALFANLETQYEVTLSSANVGGSQMAPAQAQSAYGAPVATAVAGTSFGGAIAGAGAPPNGYCQPSGLGGQPEVPIHANGHAGPGGAGMYAQPINGQHQTPKDATEHQGLAPPLPMGYSEIDHTVSPPRPAEPAAAFLLPVTQLDDVVGEMLMPFGFERPAPVVAPPPPPPPFLVDPQHILGHPETVAQPQAAPEPQVAPQPQAIAAPVATEPPPVAVAQPQVATQPVAAPPPPLFAAPVAEVTSPIAEVIQPLTQAADAPSAPPPVPNSPEQSVPGPDLITSSSESRNKKERQRKEREVSMAELARDIISISEHEPVTNDAEGDGESQAASAADDAARHASFDLVIGPAPKGGRLRRSKIPQPKDAAEELADLVSDSGLDAKMAESGADKGRRSRLRHR